MAEFITGEILPAKVLAPIGENSWQIELRGQVLTARSQVRLNTPHILVQVQALYPKPRLRILDATFPTDPHLHAALAQHGLLLSTLHITLLGELARLQVPLGSRTPGLLRRLEVWAQSYDVNNLIPFAELAAAVALVPNGEQTWDELFGNFSYRAEGLDPQNFPSLPDDIFRAWKRAEFLAEETGAVMLQQQLNEFSTALNSFARGAWNISFFLLPESDRYHLLTLQQSAPTSSDYALYRKQLTVPVYTPDGLRLEARFWQDKLGLTAFYKTEAARQTVQKEEKHLKELAGRHHLQFISIKYENRLQMSYELWCRSFGEQSVLLEV